MFDTSAQLKKPIADYLIRQIMRAGWTQDMAALRMGTSRANISRLMCRRLKHLSFNQLFRFVIKITPSAQIFISND